MSLSRTTSKQIVAHPYSAALHTVKEKLLTHRTQWMNLLFC